ncbi:MAG: efflux RND transporter periplasmic adaptor subunit [Pseudomonadota bacterium]
MKTKAMSLLMVVTLGCAHNSHAESLGCLIEPDRVADVGSQAVGVLEQIKVERGDVVIAGQVLARLSAQVERASLNVAQTKSTADAEYKQAVAASVLAQRKLERTRDLLKKDFVSDQALDQAEAEAQVAEQRVAQARESQRVAVREFHLSSAQLEQRDVRSPFAGIVMERYRTEGERVEREPLVRVARVDPLRVEAIVPAAQFGSIQAGQMALVKTDLPNFAGLNAQVTLVDRVIDPASNTFRVRMMLPNPERRIPAGLRCRVEFTSIKPAAATLPSVKVTPPTKSTVAISELKTQMSLLAQSLPGARVFEKLQPAKDRVAVKSYLLLRQARLNMTKRLTMLSVTPAPQVVVAMAEPRIVSMR